MPTQTIAPFPAGTYMLVDVIDYDTDGVTVDSVEALTVTGTFPTIATAALVVGNPRQIKITGLQAGAMSVTVSAPGVPAGSALTLACTVTAAPNLARIDLGTVHGPFPV